MIHADPAVTLQRVVWRQLEADLLQCHAAFLMDLKRRNESVVPFLIQRIYYNTDTDTTVFRDRVIPMLALPIKMKALVPTDRKVPVMSAFPPQVYQAYTPDEIKG